MVITFNHWLLPIDDQFQALIMGDSNGLGKHLMLLLTLDFGY